jgi:hypothetical protein
MREVQDRVVSLGAKNSGNVPPVQLETSSLCRTSQFILWSMRQWLRASNSPMPIYNALEDVFQMAGCEDAIPLMDETMSLLSKIACRKIILGCTCKTHLSEDELILLTIARLLGTGNHQQAIGILQPLVAGPCANSFCRTFALFIALLAQKGMTIQTNRQLALA